MDCLPGTPRRGTSHAGAKVVPLPEHIDPADEWRIVESRFTAEHEGRAETIFSLANGFLGVRRTFEEGWASLLPATFVNAFLLHPRMPPLPIVRLEPGRFMVAYGGPEPGAREGGRPWVAASWLFLVAPLGASRSRFVSRFRAASSDDLATRLSVGPTFVEPVGFVMDRQMFLGVKERAERPQGRGLRAKG